MIDKLKDILESTYGYTDINALKDIQKLMIGAGLVVGDAFVLNVHKPKCTIGKEYTIVKVEYSSEYGYEYWFLNDHNKNSVIYSDEI